ncbi:MAG: type IV toxin-antitoxin system AbiEi family antitoxin domain-containing protein [Patescibacteria group bacterium]
MSLNKLINTKKTVFTTEDLAKILNISNRNYLRVLLVRMTKRKELMRIRKSIYSLTLDYNKLELANKLKRPSYVSLDRVLFDKNIIFQDFSNIITSVSNNSFVEKIGKVEYRYHKIRAEILTNPIGLETVSGVHIANAERAICDKIYLTKNFYFDNFENVNKDLLIQISQIYNLRVVKEIKKLCSK